MASREEISYRLMDIILRQPGCEMDDLLSRCPDLSWNQFFHELDRLSRAGKVALKQIGRGHYVIAPAKSDEQRAAPVH